MKGPKSTASKRKRVSEQIAPLPNYDLSDPDAETLARENLAEIGAQRTKQNLEQHNSTGPALTGGDLDADWQGAEAVGDEAVGGHAPTPDQNVVDDLGRAVGFDAEDGEELHTFEERTARRDHHRWELNRRSADTEPTE